MTQSKEAKVLNYASLAAMIRVFLGFLLLQLFFLAEDFINVVTRKENFNKPRKILKQVALS